MNQYHIWKEKDPEGYESVAKNGSKEFIVAIIISTNMHLSFRGDVQYSWNSKIDLV